MFRDLKEYQEIAKIYAEKVSKPEDLEERRGSSVEQLKKNRETVLPATPPQKGAGGGVGNPTNTRGAGAVKFEKPTGAAQGRTRGSGAKPRPQPEIKKFPSTAEIRAKNPNAVGGGNAGASTDSGGTQGQGGAPVVKKTVVKTVVKKPEVSTMTKQGKPRTKAQMMAAKRIAAGKTISDVKAENEASMRAKAAERNQKFQAAKKSGNLAQFRKDNPKMSGADRAKAMARARLAKKAAMEEYTPYDIVLEYLLSSEQVATIEEANYVMTEMDAETIQGIVEMQGQINRADIIGGTPAAKNAVAGKGKYTPGKGVTKDFKLDPSFKLPKV